MTSVRPAGIPGAYGSAKQIDAEFENGYTSGARALARSDRQASVPMLISAAARASVITRQHARRRDARLLTHTHARLSALAHPHRPRDAAAVRARRRAHR